MELEPHSVKSQLTALFEKTDNHAERIAGMEILQEHNRKTTEAINKSSQTMEKWVADAQMILYGDEKIGIVGLVKQHNKMWLYTQRALIGGAIALYLIKELGILDKLTA